MTYVLDMDAKDEYFVPIASAHQRRAIERVGPSRHRASTNHSYVEPVVDDHAAGKVPEHIGEVHEDDLEASLPKTLADPTLLTGYPTHVIVLIRRY